MKPFRKILVPLDFSAHADHAIEVAADLARRYGASVCLLHTHEPVLYAAPESYLLYSAQQLPVLLAELKTRLDASEKQARAAGATEVTSVLLQGIAFVEIVRHAREGGFDLIVMGTHGRTGIAHALLGSVAEKIVRKAPCPVLTVRLPDQRFEHP